MYLIELIIYFISQSINNYIQLEPWNAHIIKTSAELWTPDRDITVNKPMSRFQRRSFNTLVIPYKPIPEGYKI